MLWRLVLEWDVSWRVERIGHDGVLCQGRKLNGAVSSPTTPRAICTHFSLSSECQQGDVRDRERCPGHIWLWVLKPSLRKRASKNCKKCAVNLVSRALTKNCGRLKLAVLSCSRSGSMNMKRSLRALKLSLWMCAIPWKNRLRIMHFRLSISKNSLIEVSNDGSSWT